MKKGLLLVLALLLSNAAFSAVSEDDFKMLEEQVGVLSNATGGNHLWFKPDFRFAVDKIDYTMADNTEKSQSDLMTNRLWLNMGWKYNDNLSFRGQLSYYKAFGQNLATAGTSDFSTFNWVVNENPQDDNVRVREAYFLYQSNGDLKVPYTASIGRRPSVGGFLANFREGFDDAASPLGHSINTEFDGASFLFRLENLTGISGQPFKLCLGRGSSGYTQRFNFTGADYYKPVGTVEPINFYGFIVTPYASNKFDLQLMYFNANNLIGYNQTQLSSIAGGSTTEIPKDHGDMSGGTASLLVKNVVDSGFLSKVKFFVSYAFNKTDPNSGMYMLGSDKESTGSSYWLGLNIPVILDGDSFGVEFNHGSRYWRSFTYAEDTLAGSKLATRGDAIEAYYNLPIVDKALVAQIRYTKMTYDYAGSQQFFGVDGSPMALDQLSAGQKAAVVKEAEAIRAYIRYMY